MGYVSHKMLYEAELESMIYNYEVEYFIWAEELVDCTIVVLPNKGNSTSAKHIKGRAGACLVVVDERKASPLKCVSVQMSPGDLKIYIRLDTFNSIWRLLYNDICAGIAFKRQAGVEPDITCPEDILDLSQIQKGGVRLKMEGRKLKYV